MDYRKKLYSAYVSSHLSYLYGETTIDKIEKQFKVWKSYYCRFLPEDKGSVILDAGCGNGAFLYFLKQMGFKNLTGIDISSEQIEVAKKPRD
jgi:2-polyprenyl-3-methyl-5-hydroxy-6-metoxy-1,4-benzoquinol methylase